MGKYRLTTDAKQDLSAIRKFTINEWGNVQSRKYLVELREILNVLSDNPLMGIHRSDVEDGLYSFPYASHSIYYMLKKKHIVVIGVLHGSMVPANHLEGRER